MADSEDTYDLEIDRAVKAIKDQNARIVGIQLPDGLKMQADRVSREIEAKTGATTIIWAGSNFGACDPAVDMEKLGVDLLIAWGHSEWKY